MDKLSKLGMQIRCLDDQILANFRVAVREVFEDKLTDSISPKMLRRLDYLYIPSEPPGYIPEDDKDDPDAIEYWKEERFVEWREDLDKASKKLLQLVSMHFGHGALDLIRLLMKNEVFLLSKSGRYAASDLNLDDNVQLALFLFRGIVEH